MRRAATVALLYAFVLSGFLAGLAAHADHAPETASGFELCLAGVGLEEPGAPGPDDGRHDGACCLAQCRTACPGGCASLGEAAAWDFSTRSHGKRIGLRRRAGIVQAMPRAGTLGARGPPRAG